MTAIRRSSLYASHSLVIQGTTTLSLHAIYRLSLLGLSSSFRSAELAGGSRRRLRRLLCEAVSYPSLRVR